MNTKNRDNFEKIRSGYGTVLVVVLAVACIVLLNLCYKIVSRNKAEMDQTFESNYYMAEETVNSFQKISDALFSDNDVKNFYNDLNGEYNVYRAVLAGKTIEMIESLFTDNQYSIVLTNLENDICVSSTGSARLKDAIGGLLASDAKINTIKNNNKNNKFYIYDEESGVISFVFRHQYNKNSGNFYCFIIADINILLPEENFVIADASDSYLYKPDDVGFMAIKKTYVKESEAIPGLVYKHTAKYNNIFLLIFLIVCIILCVAGMLCNRKIVKKILNITYMPLLDANRLTGTYDLLQKEEAWDDVSRRLISDSVQLQKNIKENNDFRKKTYLRNLLFDIEDYKERYLSEYGLKYLDAECRVIVMDFANRNGAPIVRERLIDGEFEKELEIQMLQNIPGEFVPVSESRYVYITSVCEKDSLRKKLVKVLNFAASSKLDVLICVGDRIRSIKEVKSSFRNALECAERKNAFPSHFVVFSSELTSDVVSFYYPIDVEVQLIDNILVGNREIVDETLNKLLDKNLREISLNADKLRELKIVIAGTINRVINRMNKEVSDVFGESSSVYLELGASRNKEEFEKNVRSVFSILCEYNESGSMSKQDKLAKEIMTFIKNNYDDKDLSLEKIARVFFVSQNHVSRVLKSKIGKSYKEYLNELRMDEAKRLLKNSPMTVLNVAQNVGYTDIRAFNRLFKKYTNHTPNEYRLML